MTFVISHGNRSLRPTGSGVESRPPAGCGVLKKEVRAGDGIAGILMSAFGRVLNELIHFEIQNLESGTTPDSHPLDTIDNETCPV